MATRQMLLFNSYSLFVGHLHPDVRKRDLAELFAGSGEILDIEVVVNKEKAHNFAFVRYRTVTGAYKAICELNGWNLMGVNIVVDMSKDTVDKLRNEGVIVKKGGIIPSLSRPQKPGMPQSSFKNKMFLTRLKEKLTAGFGGMALMSFLEDVQKCQKGSSPLWCNVSTPVSTLDSVMEQLHEKFADIGERELGEHKMTEYRGFISTIQQELGDIEPDEAEGADEVDSDNAEHIISAAEFEGREQKMKKDKESDREKRKMFVFGEKHEEPAQDDHILVKKKTDRETKQEVGEKVREVVKSKVGPNVMEDLVFKRSKGRGVGPSVLEDLVLKRSMGRGILKELVLKSKQNSLRPEKSRDELGTLNSAQNGVETLLTNKIRDRTEATNEINVANPVKTNHTHNCSTVFTNQIPVKVPATANHINVANVSTNQTEILGASIIDYHVSPQSQNVPAKFRGTNGSKNIASDRDKNVLDHDVLFERETQRLPGRAGGLVEWGPGGLRRSASSRSSSSEGINDVDSGVETDCRKSPPLKLKDLVMKKGAGRGRGRGMLMFFN